MKTIFESPNGKVVRCIVGHTVETRGGEQLLIRDMAKELERLQAANAKILAACEAISRNCDGPHSNCRDLRNDLKDIAQAALAETDP